MVESWINNGVRGVFATIDRTIFTLMAIVYEILFQITQVNIFGPDSIGEMAKKIYTLLGIFMLFKFIYYLLSRSRCFDR